MTQISKLLLAQKKDWKQWGKFHILYYEDTLVLHTVGSSQNAHSSLAWTHSHFFLVTSHPSSDASEGV